MSRPENGIYIIQGEVNLVVTAMRRNSRWSSHTHQVTTAIALLAAISILHMTGLFSLQQCINFSSGVKDQFLWFYRMMSRTH